MKANKQTMVTVELTHSVPINGKMHKRGRSVEVTPSLAKDLRRRGKVVEDRSARASSDPAARAEPAASGSRPAASRPAKQD